MPTKPDWGSYLWTDRREHVGVGLKCNGTTHLSFEILQKVVDVWVVRVGDIDTAHLAELLSVLASAMVYLEENCHHDGAGWWVDKMATPAVTVAPILTHVRNVLFEVTAPSGVYRCWAPLESGGENVLYPITKDGRRLVDDAQLAEVRESIGRYLDSQLNQNLPPAWSE